MPNLNLDKMFFILTLHTVRQSLDWPLISILTSQPIHKMCTSPAKKNHDFSFYEKTVSWKILERHLLVGKKVLYKFPNDTASKLSKLHVTSYLLAIMSVNFTKCIVTELVMIVMFIFVNLHHSEAAWLAQKW